MLSIDNAMNAAEAGSFIEAARKMHVTQSTVSARVKVLEDLLGRPLFQRSKNGASLTAAGEQFRKHALALVRVWQHAQLEVGLSDQHRDHLSVGSPLSLWEGFLLRWIAWLRSSIPDIAISTTAGLSSALTQRLLEGSSTRSLYRPAAPPRRGASVRRGVRLVTSGKSTAAATFGLEIVNWVRISSRPRLRIRLATPPQYGPGRLHFPTARIRPPAISDAHGEAAPRARRLKLPKVNSSTPQYDHPEALTRIFTPILVHCVARRRS